MQAEFKTAQLRVKPNAIIAEGSGGTIFYATPTRARALIDAGAAELVNAPAAQPEIGPSETKPKEPAEKKSLRGEADGRSTASAPSIEHGPDQPSSSSAAAHRSPKASVKPSPKRGRPAKSKR